MYVPIALAAVGKSSEDYFCLIVYCGVGTDSQEGQGVLKCHPLGGVQSSLAQFISLVTLYFNLGLS